MASPNDSLLCNACQHFFLAVASKSFFSPYLFQKIFFLTSSLQTPFHPLFNPPSSFHHPFTCRPVGMPCTEHVRVENKDPHLPLHLLSIAGSTSHYHCSFFEDKVACCFFKASLIFSTLNTLSTPVSNHRLHFSNYHHHVFSHYYLISNHRHSILHCYFQQPLHFLLLSLPTPPFSPPSAGPSFGQHHIRGVFLTSTFGHYQHSPLHPLLTRLLQI